jgi:hypothetical protein
VLDNVQLSETVVLVGSCELLPPGCCCSLLLATVMVPTTMCNVPGGQPGQVAGIGWSLPVSTPPAPCHAPLTQEHSMSSLRRGHVLCCCQGFTAAQR